MSRFPNFLNVCVVVAVTCPLVAHAAQDQSRRPRSPRVATARTALLWRDPGDLKSRSLIYGAGGSEHQPSGTFTFVKEDKGGTQPKFEIIDQHGVRWKAKLGEEARTETAATRLVWAAGYFADEDYYLPRVRINKMPKLTRGQEYVTAKGLVQGVRLERVIPGQKKTGNWSWSDNPFEGTRELNGLRILMALINNWDLKTPNNAIYQSRGGQRYYVVSDLGATFGRTGGVGTFRRTKDSVEDYSKSKFIDEVERKDVDLVLKSRPLFLLAVDPYHYLKLAGRSKVAKDIPREDVKWMGQLLGRLSTERIRDGFRAAGYSPQEVEGFTRVVQKRIASLNHLK